MQDSNYWGVLNELNIRLANEYAELDAWVRERPQSYSFVLKPQLNLGDHRKVNSGWGALPLKHLIYVYSDVLILTMRGVIKNTT